MTTMHEQRATLPRLSADRLAEQSVEELETLYRGGVLPAIDELDGAPPGRMLTLAGPLGRAGLRGAVANLARHPAFPWAGKTFHSSSATIGGGINRVRLLGDRYPFDTRVEPSAIDGKPCVLLDYRRPDNPFFIRPIRDELRKVGQGLYLGPAMLDLQRGTPRLVLWFAIDKT
ncbi:MAG: hypothetical protein AAGE52_01665 [Myxococcota bacterium]